VCGGFAAGGLGRIVRKWLSFDSYSQEDISLMMNHISFYTRKALGRRSPYENVSVSSRRGCSKKNWAQPPSCRMK
jgi:hypothetical protein